MFFFRKALKNSPKAAHKTKSKNVDKNKHCNNFQQEKNSLSKMENFWKNLEIGQKI